MNDIPEMRQAGSSPRPWGTPCGRGTGGGRSRFIPTPVGNTLDEFVGNDIKSGSSPRPWGTQRRVARPRGEDRFIPTPVGNTRTNCSGACCITVHPHARGEHRAFGKLLLASVGSSPRPWGTRRYAGSAGSGWRFIPTPVGNTLADHMIMLWMAVHPHARGEHIKRTARARPSYGSSPRPWGTLVRCQLAHRPIRFIPTPVGNTATSSTMADTRAVHPHARGEHGAKASAMMRAYGSSPRPWGTRAVGKTIASLTRFIPTPVGNTLPCLSFLNDKTVHPHARGEHRCHTKATHGHSGSSPRPWGTLQRVQGSGYIQRFIPTPVGNTCGWQDDCQPDAVHPHARGEHVSISFEKV